MSDSGSALNCAAAVGTLAVFELLLRHGARIENSQPMHMAAASEEDAGRIPMMEYLVGKGVDVNGSDGARGVRAVGPPLLYAVRQGQVEKVRWLLGHGADARVEGRGGATALGMAERTGLEEVVGLVAEAVGRGGEGR